MQNAHTTLEAERSVPSTPAQSQTNQIAALRTHIAAGLELRIVHLNRRVQDEQERVRRRNDQIGVLIKEVARLELNGTLADEVLAEVEEMCSTQERLVRYASFYYCTHGC